MLCPGLEVADLSGDAVASVQRGEEIPGPPEGGQFSAPTGLAAEAVAGFVDAVLDVVGDVPDLLDPVLGLLVVGGSGGGGVPDLAEEGVHAGELVVHVLDLAVDAADERLLLGEEAAELAKQRSHGALGGAHGELRARSALAGPASAASCLLFFVDVVTAEIAGQQFLQEGKE